MRRAALIAALVVAALAAPGAEYVIRDPEAVKSLLAVKDTVAFSDAQLSAVLEWLNARYQIETAMGRDAAGKPDVEHSVAVQPTLTIRGEMPLSELLDLAAAGTGWSWSVDTSGTVVFMPPADAALAPAATGDAPKATAAAATPAGAAEKPADAAPAPAPASAPAQ